jgi:spermidine synthase
VSQEESSHYEITIQVKRMETLQVFPICTLYNFHNLTYPSGFCLLSYASKNIHPIQILQPEHIENSGLKFQYYSAQVHQASFIHPAFQKDIVDHLVKLKIES